MCGFRIVAQFLNLNVNFNFAYESLQEISGLCTFLSPAQYISIHTCIYIYCPLWAQFGTKWQRPISMQRNSFCEPKKKVGNDHGFSVQGEFGQSRVAGAVLMLAVISVLGNFHDMVHGNHVEKNFPQRNCSCGSRLMRPAFQGFGRMTMMAHRKSSFGCDSVHCHRLRPPHCFKFSDSWVRCVMHGANL